MSSANIVYICMHTVTVSAVFCMIMIVMVNGITGSLFLILFPMVGTEKALDSVGRARKWHTNCKKISSPTISTLEDVLMDPS